MDVDAPAPPSTSASALPSASASSPNTTTEPRRRNRPALSCIQCRTRKIRCDRMEPCASCLKSKIVNCTYEEARRPKPRLWRLSPAQDPDSPTAEDPYQRFPSAAGYTFRPESQSAASTVSGHQYASSAASLPGARTSEPARASSPALRHGDSLVRISSPSSGSNALAERVRQLEQQLADALRRPDPSPQAYESAQLSQQPTPASSQSALPKTVYAGSSPWMNRPNFFPLISSLAERIEADTSSKAYYFLHKCNAMGRSIKASVQRPSDQLPFDIGSSLLPEPTTRRLVEAYFRTFDGVYRVLHGPTFWNEYQRYWDSSSSASEAFGVQFKLCIIIGACFHDDIATHRQALAAKWMKEARVWLASVEDKSRMTLANLQVMCLLHLAQETCGVGGDLGWVSAGSLLRTAMYMGIHRDPDSLPKMSILQAEMRRRLWASVQEIVLQSSIDSGGPPMLTLSDFDTRQPSNYDDDQLTESEQFVPSPRPLGCFTQTTVQLALLRSFPTRLAIAHYVNQLNSTASYEETLKWNSELTNACRVLSATLQPSYDPAGVLPKRLSLFQLRLAEHMVHRFFLALNHPWLAQNNPTYYFARKVCVETSLKLYRAIATGSPAGDSGTASQTDDFTRLATCGHGAFRSVPTLAVLSICLELLWQVQDDRSFRQSMDIDHQLNRSEPGENDASASGVIGSGAAPRQDLLEAVRYAIVWTNRRILSGETNIKGRLFYPALLTQVQALQRGASDAEVEQVVLSSVEGDLEHCWHLLKDLEAVTSKPSHHIDRSDASEWDYDDLDRNRWQGFKSIFNTNDVECFVRG